MESPSDPVAELKFIHERARRIEASSKASLGIMVLAMLMVVGSVVFSISRVAPLERIIATRHAEIDALDAKKEAIAAENAKLEAQNAHLNAGLQATNMDLAYSNADRDRLVAEVLGRDGKSQVSKGWVWIGIYDAPDQKWLRAPFDVASAPEDLLGKTQRCKARVYLRGDAPKPPDYGLGIIIAVVKKGTLVKILQVSKGKKSSWFGEIELVTPVSEALEFRGKPN